MAIAEVAESPPYITVPGPGLDPDPILDANPEAAPPAPRRHPEYYFTDGNLVIQVSDTLFRLWDGALRRHSTAFPVPVASPQMDNKGGAGVENGNVAPGTDDAHPLVLEGIESVDFERLLWVIYPPVIGQCLATTPGDWTAILSLATRYAFPAIRTLALRELGALSMEDKDMDPVSKIALLAKYDVPRQWAYGAFVALCARPGALELEEGRRLGVEMTVLVAGAREKLDKWGRKKPEEVKKVVAEVFEIAEPV
ncbi:hypothetical protein C8R44DRAFT_972864 [Mycena epipterygia]|nr:hypothetical protein C8R44DRAFT_972864 [Mycena epipterygia]